MNSALKRVVNPQNRVHNGYYNYDDDLKEKGREGG